MDDKVKRGLAVIAANYLKRYLEKPYDRIFETDFGRRLQEMDQKAKYLIEFILNALTAFLEQKFSEDSGLKRMIQEVGLDAAPEFSKRMLNGIKGDLQHKAVRPEEQEWVRSLLQLDDNEFRSILNWLLTVPEEKRRSAIRQVSGLRPEELLRFSRLDPEDRDRILELITPPKKKAALWSDVSREVSLAADKLNDWAERLKRKKAGK